MGIFPEHSHSAGRANHNDGYAQAAGFAGFQMMKPCGLDRRTYAVYYFVGTDRARALSQQPGRPLANQRNFEAQYLSNRRGNLECIALSCYGDGN